MPESFLVCLKDGQAKLFPYYRAIMIKVVFHHIGHCFRDFCNRMSLVIEPHDTLPDWKRLCFIQNKTNHMDYSTRVKVVAPIVTYKFSNSPVALRGQVGLHRFDSGISTNILYVVKPSWTKLALI